MKRIKKELPFIREFGCITESHSRPLPYHRNEGFEFVYVISGHYRWELESGKMLDVKGKQFSMTLPYVIHRGYLDHINPGTILFIVFDPDDPAFAKLTRISGENAEIVGKKLEKQGNCTAQGSAALDLSANSLVLKLTKELQDTDKKQVGEALLINNILQFLLLSIDAMVEKNEMLHEHPLSSLMDYIESHIDEPLSIAALEKVSGWGRTYLFHLFRSHIGQTPNDYTQSLRCDRAREMLEVSDKPIIEIALDLGFSSSQYFSRVFRKYSGLSPSEYRKRVSD